MVAWDLNAHVMGEPIYESHSYLQVLTGVSPYLGGYEFLMRNCTGLTPITYQSLNSLLAQIRPETESAYSVSETSFYPARFARPEPECCQTGFSRGAYTARRLIISIVNRICYEIAEL